VLSVYAIGSEVRLVPAATVAEVLPPFQVSCVMELVLGAVATGPMPASAITRAAVGEAVTVTLMVVAPAVNCAWAICSRQLRVALSVEEVLESTSEKIVAV
jgi:hypothetical protein